MSYTDRRRRQIVFRGLVTLLAALAAMTAAAPRAAAGDGRPGAQQVQTYQITGDGQGTVINFEGNLVFIDAVLLREMGLLETPAPSDAQVEVGLRRLYRFYRESGYTLVRIKPRRRGKTWNIYIDEGLLDSIIVVGAGWLNTYLVRRDLLPYDVFNTYRVKQWLGQIARTYNLEKVEYRVITLNDDDAGAFEENVGYLEHFADSFLDLKMKPRYRLEVIIHKKDSVFDYTWGLFWDSTYGLGLEGHLRFGSVVLKHDRYGVYASVSGNRRASLQPGGGTDTVFTRAQLGLKGETPPLGVSWLRLAVHSFADLYNQQRADVPLQQLMYLKSEHALTLAARATDWMEIDAFGGYEVLKILATTAVTGDPVTISDTFTQGMFTGGALRFNLTKPVLRRDLQDTLLLDGRVYFRFNAGNFYRLHMDYQQVFFFGASELILRAGGRWRFGNSRLTDEFPVAGSHMRASWGRYALKAGYAGAEFRLSLYRQLFKIGLLNDMAVYGLLDRNRNESPVYADALGPGLFFMFFDVFLLKLYYAVGLDSNLDVAHTFSFSLNKVF